MIVYVLEITEIGKILLFDLLTSKDLNPIEANSNGEYTIILDAQFIQTPIFFIEQYAKIKYIYTIDERNIMKILPRGTLLLNYSIHQYSIRNRKPISKEYIYLNKKYYVLDEANTKSLFISFFIIFLTIIEFFLF